MEESTQFKDGEGEYQEGLTDFLRSEYFRRYGIFVNGAQDEYDRLRDFWKDNVSQSYA